MGNKLSGYIGACCGNRIKGYVLISVPLVGRKNLDTSNGEQRHMTPIRFVRKPNSGLVPDKPAKQPVTAWRVSFEQRVGIQIVTDEVIIIGRSCSQIDRYRFVCDGVRYSVDGEIRRIESDQDHYKELCNTGGVPRLGPPTGWISRSRT